MTPVATSATAVGDTAATAVPIQVRPSRPAGSEAERKAQRDIAHRQQAAFRVEFLQLVPQLLQVLRGRRARLRRVRRQRGCSGPLDGEQAEHAGDATSDHLRGWLVAAAISEGTAKLLQKAIFSGLRFLQQARP